METLKHPQFSPPLFNSRVARPLALVTSTNKNFSLGVLNSQNCIYCCRTGKSVKGRGAAHQRANMEPIDYVKGNEVFDAS
jgi:hypothetical protein